MSKLIAAKGLVGLPEPEFDCSGNHYCCYVNDGWSYLRSKNLASLSRAVMITQLTGLNSWEIVSLCLCLKSPEADDPYVLQF